MAKTTVKTEFGKVINKHGKRCPFCGSKQYQVFKFAGVKVDKHKFWCAKCYKVSYDNK